MSGTEALVEGLQLERELAARRGRQGLLGFTLATHHDYEVNWHHRRVCQLMNSVQRGETARQLLAAWGVTGRALERMLQDPHPVTGLYAGLTSPAAIDRPLRRVQVCLSPRHGKSELVSRQLPAWLFGNDPNTHIIACSYGSDLAGRMNRDCQRIIDTHTYRSMFPDVGLNASVVRTSIKGGWLRNTDIFEIVGHRGVYRAAGIGQGITGLGGNVCIIDDPFKSRKTADSPLERKHVHDWYASTLYTRLEKDGVIILINTRWHESDLSGFVLQQAFADPLADQWFCAVFPAILDCEPGPGDPRKHGEALWPGKYNIERLKQIRATIGAYEFEALHQQRPAPPEGGVIKEAWWRYYDALPQDVRKWSLSVDLSFADRGDFNAFTVWAQAGANHYLVELVHGRMNFTDQVRAFESICRRYPQIKAKYVEAAANGAALIDTLKKKIPGIIAVRPQGSKQLRVDAVSPLFEAGNVYLPSKQVAPWADDVILEFRNFPNGAHDDIVDSVSQYLARAAGGPDYLSGTMPGSFTRKSPWLAGPGSR